MAGLRDVLIHNYLGVDLAIVWDVIENRLPDLERQIGEIRTALASAPDRS